MQIETDAEYEPLSALNILLINNMYNMQPIPGNIKKEGAVGLRPFNTLLVDGSNLLEICHSASHVVSSGGMEVGAIYMFLLQLKHLLAKGSFRYVFVMWDGERSGQLRRNIYAGYKANRDKSYDEPEESEYMRRLNRRIRCMEKKIYGTDPGVDDKAVFHWQRSVLMRCLDELFVRQCMYEETEADDFIGYYVSHKKPEESVVIFSNDMDMAQLIHRSTLYEGRDDVIIAMKRPKEDIRFLNSRNFAEFGGVHYENVRVRKIVCGDASDNIKGVRGVGLKTLTDNFPELLTRPVSIEDIVDGARKINEARAAEKKKPLKWAENIVGGVTDGPQGGRLYEVNARIIDLSDPLMPDGAKGLIESMMHAPMDPEGRSFENLYRIIVENDIDKLKDESFFSTFFTEYKYVINNELVENR